MSYLLLFVLASYGLYFVVAHSGLPGWYPFRVWLMGKSDTLRELLSCPMCCGFWCSGLVATACLFAGIEVTSVLSVGIHALAGAAAVYFLETYVSRLESR